MWVRLIVRQEPVAALIVDGRVAMGDRLAALFTAQAERVGALVSASGGATVDLEFRGTRLSDCALVSRAAEKLTFEYGAKEYQHLPGARTTHATRSAHGVKTPSGPRAASKGP
jgi:hypothetical protein